MFKLLDAKGQASLLNHIYQDLDTNFDKERYYLLSIYDIIDYKRYFDKYLDTFPPCTGPLPSREMFSNSELKHESLSKLLNLCFKEAVDLKETVFEKLHGFPCIMTGFLIWMGLTMHISNLYGLLNTRLHTT